MASPRSFFDAQAQSNRSIGVLVALLLVALVVLLGGLYLLGLALQPEPVVERHRMESRFNAAGEFETVFIDRPRPCPGRRRSSPARPSPGSPSPM